jgi:hypothetical protein
MRFWNRRINVYRGTEVNEYGDLTDIGTGSAPHLAGVPAAIAETAQVATDQATQRQQIVRTITCQVPAWADIVTTDTIEDPATGYWYIIEDLQEAPGIGYYPPPKTLTLRMRSGVSVSSD